MADDAVAKCYGCNHWFQLIATEPIGTVQDGDVRITQRWCIGCLNDIESNTRSVIEMTSEYPAGTEPWEKEETGSDKDKDED